MDTKTNQARNLVGALQKFYGGMTSEEKAVLSGKLSESAKLPQGSQIVSAIFNFICPDTGKLVSANGFNAHGGVDDDGNVEALITVDCKGCMQSHPITTISIPDMLSMPLDES